jgi:transposase InsO family protein
MGHLSTRSIKYLSNHGLAGGLLHLEGELKTCEACQKGRQVRENFPKRSITRVQVPLEVVHSNLCGPMPTTSLSGSRYFVTFTDNFIRYMWIYFMKNKSQTLEKFQLFKKLVENMIGKKIRTFRTDGRGEYISNSFTNFLKQSGIRRQKTQPDTPQ